MTVLHDIAELMIELVRSGIYSNSHINAVEDEKNYYITISEKHRFAISKKDQCIYGCRNKKVNKKENYGTLSAWREWDWSGYYPYRKCLYEWQKTKESTTSAPIKAKAKRKRARKSECVIVITDGDWPYTTGDRSEIRRSRRKRKSVGEAGAPERGSEAGGDNGDTAPDHGRKESDDRRVPT